MDGLQGLETLRHLKHVKLSAVTSNETPSGQLFDVVRMAARPDRPQLRTVTLFGRHFEQKGPGQWIRVREGEEQRRVGQMFGWADRL